MPDRGHTHTRVGRRIVHAEEEGDMRGRPGDNTAHLEEFGRIRAGRFLTLP